MGYQNFFATRLATDAGAADTTLTLESAPSKTSGRLVLEARNPTQREIISYTGVSGSQVTGVTRGLGGTTAKTHTKTALVEMNLTAEDIQDLYDAFQSFAASNNDWRTAVTTFSVASGYNKGNKEFVLDSTNDMTSILSAGMRLKLTRGVSPPTRCATFVAASSQYASKATPSGISFTDDFTVEAWIEISAYTAQECIVGMYNGTSGWRMLLNQNGQLIIAGNNAGSGNIRYGTSYPSVPTGRKVHVAATLDMSGNVSNMYFDGAPVPSFMTASGTNPTSLLQAGNLQIGADNGATELFNGNIAEVRLWSTVRTATQIRDNMYQQLVGTETGLIGYWKLDGSWNDSTANANNLTPSGGAVNTTTSNPFNSVEFAIITKVTSTQVTVFTGTDYSIPNMSLTNPAYSAAKEPYGFPVNANKWRVNSVMIAGYSQSNNGGVIALKFNLSVPTGAWKLGYTFNAIQVMATGTHNSRYSLDTTSGATPSLGSLLTSSGTFVSATEYYPRLSAHDNVDVSTQTVYYLNGQAIGSNFTNQGVWAIPGQIYAECAYV